MTEVSYGRDGLHVRFPGWEAHMAGREMFIAPTASVRGAHAEAGWSSEILGVRSGLVVSGFRKVGVFTHTSGVRRLVSMKRGLPLLRVAVDRESTQFDEVLVSVPEAAAIADAIRAAG